MARKLVARTSTRSPCVVIDITQDFQIPVADVWADMKTAQVFAAAPELLEATEIAEREIRALTGVIGRGVLTDKVLHMLETAIAKAKGEA